MILLSVDKKILALQNLRAFKMRQNENTTKEKMQTTFMEDSRF